MNSKRVHMIPHQTLNEYLSKIDQPRHLSLVISNERTSFRYKGIVWNPNTDSINLASKHSTPHTKSTESSKKNITPPQTKQYFQRILFSKQEPIHSDKLDLGQEYCEEISEILERTSVRDI